MRKMSSVLVFQDIFAVSLCWTFIYFWMAVLCWYIGAFLSKQRVAQPPLHTCTIASQTESSFGRCWLTGQNGNVDGHSEIWCQTCTSTSSPCDPTQFRTSWKRHFNFANQKAGMNMLVELTEPSKYVGVRHRRRRTWRLSFCSTYGWLNCCCNVVITTRYKQV